MPKSKPFNPFYPLLMVVGVIFAITACAYGVMAVQLLDPFAASASGAGHPLIAFMDQHGLTVMVVQLIILGVATVAAIATDDIWTRRARGRRPHEQEAEERS